MGIFANPWRRIGTRLYLALGFAVVLTLVSSAVGVYYFERSGDLSHRVKVESVPVLEASWAAAREVDGLRYLGTALLSRSTEGSPEVSAVQVDDTLSRLEAALAQVNSVPSLESHSEAVYDGAYDLADIMSGLSVNRTASMQADDDAAQVRARLDAVVASDQPSASAAEVLRQALQSDDEAELERLWSDLEALVGSGASPSVLELAEDDGVFFVRRQQLALRDQADELARSFEQSSGALQATVSTLLDEARSESSSTSDAALQSFDQGRVLLAIISVASVVAATMAAWLWVGNGLVRRLSRLSDRMRGMATGDLETPVPEVGRDEIGELADALEVFRQQALEVQRLNLVEQLYGQLREANAELQRMQDRLVAQEKLAALGELVSGVAHEISNPLNFVKNFSEGSQELYGELSDMLRTYRDEMSSEDAALLDDITEELTTSLNRVRDNGGRALAIVERMRGLGVVGGEPMPTDVNPLVRRAVQLGCDTFRAEWQDFEVEPVYELDNSFGPVPMVGQDFSEALVNLVSNACYAMRTKRESAGADGYEPQLRVSSQLVGRTVEVRVRDNGTGIPDDVVGHIFNPFFTTREGAMGAGLGLSIAADVARRAGGDLTVDTEDGEYTEFTLSVPAEEVALAAV
ncbi:MAG: HAMP domain-containing sensor histidine kinase [Chloroflexi bacterium]|nr:HAMP domain-containing sensor histidine kinase [Chloroflexota bacterium]